MKKMTKSQEQVIATLKKYGTSTFQAASWNSGSYGIRLVKAVRQLEGLGLVEVLSSSHSVERAYHGYMPVNHIRLVAKLV